MNNELLIKRFERYVKCGSESHNERDFCEMLEQDLEKMKISYERQELGTEIITNGWNILAKVEGDVRKPPVLFVFHTDTVAPGNDIKPYCEAGMLQSRGNTILGADGKLAIALVLQALEEETGKKRVGRPIELLFTVCQELGLQGARYADYSKILSEEALVIDHYVTGEILSKTPGVCQLNVELIGREAHVILDASSGINALQTAVKIVSRLPLGRVNENLNVNVSNFVSLSRANIVPKHARFDLEIRAFGNELFEKTIGEIKNLIRNIAKESNCECNIQEQISTRETIFDTNEDMIRRLKKIYDKVGIEMKLTKSFGYLDASCTSDLGIRTIPVGISIYNTHSAREYVNLKELKVMSDLIEKIVSDF